MARSLAELNIQRNALKEYLEKNTTDISAYEKLATNLSDTAIVLESESRFHNQRGRDVLEATLVRLKNVQVTIDLLKEVKNTQECRVGTGGWGLGKCDKPGVHLCPRCLKYCCEIHKTSVRTYKGEPVCEPCCRDMQG